MKLKKEKEMNELLTKSINIYKDSEIRKNTSMKQRAEADIRQYFGDLSINNLKETDKAGCYSLTGTSWDLYYSDWQNSFTIWHKNYSNHPGKYSSTPIRSMRDLGESLNSLIKKFGI